MAANPAKHAPYLQPGSLPCRVPLEASACRIKCGPQQFDANGHLYYPLCGSVSSLCNEDHNVTVISNNTSTVSIIYTVSIAHSTNGKCAIVSLLGASVLTFCPRLGRKFLFLLAFLIIFFQLVAILDSFILHSEPGIFFF